MDQIDSNTPFYQDKAWWLTVATPVLLWLAHRFGFQLSAEMIGEIAGALVSVYTVAHKFKSAMIDRAKVQAAGLVKQQEIASNAHIETQKLIVHAPSGRNIVDVAPPAAGG